MKQEIMGWQWHHPDHMQIICTSLPTDNHASTSPKLAAAAAAKLIELRFYIPLNTK